MRSWPRQSLSFLLVFLFTLTFSQLVFSEEKRKHLTTIPGVKYPYSATIRVGRCSGVLVSSSPRKNSRIIYTARHCMSNRAMVYGGIFAGKKKYLGKVIEWAPEKITEKTIDDWVFGALSKSANPQVLKEDFRPLSLTSFHLGSVMGIGFPRIHFQGEHLDQPGRYYGHTYGMVDPHCSISPFPFSKETDEIAGAHRSSCEATPGSSGGPLLSCFFGNCQVRALVSTGFIEKDQKTNGRPSTGDSIVVMVTFQHQAILKELEERYPIDSQ